MNLFQPSLLWSKWVLDLKYNQVFLIADEGLRANANQNHTQFGFSKGVNYLLARIFRENLMKLSEDTRQTLYLMASDITNAFSLTNREAQLVENLLASLAEVSTPSSATR